MISTPGDIAGTIGKPGVQVDEQDAGAAPLARVLVVDDDPIVAESLAAFIEDSGYISATAGDGREAIEMIASANGELAKRRGEKRFGLVVTDMNMPRCDGLDLLKQIREKHPEVSSIVITGYGKIEAAVDAIKAGACDYLTKPIVDEELLVSISKAMQQHLLLAENRDLKSQLNERYGLGQIVGADYRMQRVYELIETVAPTPTTVLIEGESGTGKSLIARAIHNLSDRASKPIITFACGSIPETLLESELFGHVKGAFTGADYDKPGKILAADGGTLFIDEINSATPALQLKLLRVLQEKQFEPIGSHQTVRVDVRFILATNQSLKKLMEDGVLREDLYYRINVINVRIPPMRERLGDVQMLAEYFIQRHCKALNKTVTGLTPEALEALRCYLWPGNVRELENAIERAVVLTRRPMLDVIDFPESVQHAFDVGPAGLLRDGADCESITGASSGGLSLDDPAVIPALVGGWRPMPLADAMAEPERRIIQAALEANDWNRQDTAKQLEINRTTLYKKMKQLGLDRPE